MFLKFRDTLLQTNMSVEFKIQLFIQIIWTIWQEVSCIIIRLINFKILIN